MIQTRGKNNYLYIISMAGFGVILIIVIVNEVYEKRTKGVKFYLSVRIIQISVSIWFRRLSGPLLGRFFDNLCLGARCLGRFILWLLLPERVIALSKMDKILREYLKNTHYIHLKKAPMKSQNIPQQASLYRHKD